MSDALSSHLTQPNADLGHMIARTPSGMAFWSGTGPGNTTCRECVFFDHQHSYYAKKGIGGGSLKPAKCKKFKALAQSSGGAVPHDTRSCKYFEPAPVPPPVVSK
ncbi:hypothetical protein CRBSH125_35010 [Afipia carboxidovorans]|nr:hypothetical protein CRBSH125_35010 [Afipia carboxidovorans]